MKKINHGDIVQYYESNIGVFCNLEGNTIFILHYIHLMSIYEVY